MHIIKYQTVTVLLCTKWKEESSLLTSIFCPPGVFQIFFPALKVKMKKYQVGEFENGKPKK
jgi:hypothetical protein